MRLVKSWLKGLEYQEWLTMTLRLVILRRLRDRRRSLTLVLSLWFSASENSLKKRFPERNLCTRSRNSSVMVLSWWIAIVEDVEVGWRVDHVERDNQQIYMTVAELNLCSM